MAQDKETFIAYAEWIETFEMLENEEAGKLIKHLLAYVNDKNPEMEDRMLKILFQPMKMQLKRDLKKYEEIKKKRAQAGKKGGKKTQAQAKQANASSAKQNQSNQAVHVNDNGNVNDNDISSSNEEGVYKQIDTLKKDYLADFRLCNAITETLNLKSNHQLSELLTEFNKHLTTTGSHSKSWSDYTSHFLNWNRRKKDIEVKNQSNSSYNVPIG